MDNNIFYYNTPANEFEEALPLGNGRIGAMVYGRTDTEKISLNECTLWSGKPYIYNDVSHKNQFETAKNMLLKNEYLESQRYMEENLTFEYTDAYMPLGDIKITFSNDTGDVKDYVRSLNLSEAVSRVDYEAGGVKMSREYFISHSKQLLFVRFSANGKNTVSFDAGIESQLKNEIFSDGEALVMYGECPNRCDPVYWKSANPIRYGISEEDKGVRFCGALKVFADGSETVIENNKITVRNAKEAFLVFGVRTSFKSFDKPPVDNGRETYKQVIADIQKIVKNSYSDYLAEHKEAHGELYNRVEFTLEAESEEKMTEKRIINYMEDKGDISLPALLFNYGRYLLISSSRKGGQATNLQGIWNENMFPGWSSNYTVNINTQMNYWPPFITSLPECAAPFFEFMKNLAVNASKVANKIYGSDGACVFHNSSLWLTAHPVGEGRVNACARYAFGNDSFAWLCRTLYEYYSYTLDVNYLREEAYPLFKKAVLFYLDTAMENEDGYYIFPITTSPENSFLIDGKWCALSKNATITSAVAMDITDIFLKSSNILGISDDFTVRIAAFKNKILPYRIDEFGALTEWYENYPETQQSHRHISHLYGLFPGNSIDPEKQPDLAKAVKKTLERRGEDGCGWTFAWKCCIYARLFDGDNCLSLIDKQLRFVSADKTTTEKNKNMGASALAKIAGTYPNLFGAPPFQIDSNFGITAGIAYMLLQSHAGYINILPALPSAWKNGSVMGLTAEGNIKVDIVWKNGKPEKVTLRSAEPKTVRVRYKNNYYNAEIKKGIKQVSFKN